MIKIIITLTVNSERHCLHGESCKQSAGAFLRMNLGFVSEKNVLAARVFTIELSAGFVAPFSV